MRFLAIFLFLFSFAFGALHHLTEDNFDDFISNQEISLVEFFAPWCGHCKALAPHFAAAAEQLDGIAALADVDCTVQKDLCNKYGVRGFPTMKVFRNDGSEPTEYNAGRQTEDIVRFMKRQKAPAYRTLSASELSTIASGEEPVVIVGFFDSLESEAAKEFINVAKSLRNEYSFAVVTGDEVKAAGKAAPLVVLYRGSEETTHAVDFTAESISNFISVEAFPLVGEIGPETYQKYVERGYPLVWIFVDYKAPETANIIRVAEETAKQFKGKLSLVKLDGIRWAEHSKHFGLSGTPPGIVVEDREQNKNYVFPQSAEITVEALTAHLQGFLDGTLAPTVKSEEIPASQDGPVYVVVGKTFEEIVNDPERDVLIEFYAPWCGHCKNLAPKYDRLGEQFKNVPSVRIAKIDATANDVPVDIRGFPTIMLYPANDKANPVTYEGERTEAALAQFIREHGSTLKGKDSSEKTHSDEL